MESCCSPFDKDFDHTLSWAFRGDLQNLQRVSYDVVAEHQKSGVCCFRRWGPLQMALAGGCEKAVIIVLHALANSVSWGHPLPPELVHVNLQVLETPTLRRCWSKDDWSPSVTCLIERFRKGWKAYQTIPWGVQRVIMAGRRQRDCVWWQLPRDLVILIFKQSSVVRFLEVGDSEI